MQLCLIQDRPALHRVLKIEGDFISQHHLANLDATNTFKQKPEHELETLSECTHFKLGCSINIVHHRCTHVS